MGVNTNLFVTAKKEAILDVMPIVIKKLNEYIRHEMDAYADRKGFESRIQFAFRDKEAGVNKDLKDFTNGIYNTETIDFGSFNINFTIHGEKRNLFITHTCSSDYSDVYEGEKIIFSLGAWGMSEEIMKVVGDAVKEFGYVYYCSNDSMYDFVELK